MIDPLFDLSGRVALVTGTSRGLGQYFARALARAGADIAMTSRSMSGTTTVSRMPLLPSKSTSVISKPARHFS